MFYGRRRKKIEEKRRRRERRENKKTNLNEFKFNLKKFNDILIFFYLIEFIFYFII